MKAKFIHGVARRQQGFSLVELMVAVTLSLLLMVGVVALFVSSRTNYEYTERLSRIQENGRYALDQLTGNIREAGFNGCTRPLNTYARRGDYEINTLTDPTSLLLNFPVPVQGYNANGDDSWSPDIAPVDAVGVEPDKLSDVLVLRVPRRDVTPLRLNKTQVSGTETLEVVPVAGGALDDGDIAMISDCEGRAYFQVTTYDEDTGEITHAVGGTSKNISDDLKHPFREGAEIVPMETVIYFLKLRDGTADTTQLSLWRKTGANAAEELAEGIERMEVLYGVDTDGNGRVDTYVAADAVTDWVNVMTARVALLARSPEAYGTDRDPEAYTLLDVTVPAKNDRHQRQVFTTTISLRNQVID